MNEKTDDNLKDTNTSFGNHSDLAKKYVTIKEFEAPNEGMLFGVYVLTNGTPMLIKVHRTYVDANIQRLTIVNMMLDFSRDIIQNFTSVLLNGRDRDETETHLASI